MSVFCKLSSSPVTSQGRYSWSFNKREERGSLFDQRDADSFEEDEDGEGPDGDDDEDTDAEDEE